MQIILTPTGIGAGAGAQQTLQSSGWGINIPVQIEEPNHIKLATGGDLAKLEGRVSIQRRPLTTSDVQFVGEIKYYEGKTADAEIPSFPETFWVVLYVSGEIFEDTLRLCAMGYLPTMTLNFPDDQIGEHLEIIPKAPNGLTYIDAPIIENIAWDNKKFKSVGIKSSDLSFSFIAPARKTIHETRGFGNSVSKADTEATLPATHQQMAMLIHMVRNVGIGLGVLAIILHFLR